MVAINYAAGLLLASLPAGGKRKIVLIAAIVLTAAALVYCKYTNFLLDTLNVIASTGFAKLSFLDVLPLGISYYTFKLISYTADVYTGKIKAERSPVVFAVYVLMYPQLIVGPIVKYRDMADVLHQTQGRCTLQKAQDGAEMFVFGLAKKVILADSIAALWQDIIGTGGIGLANASLPLAWLGIIAYSLQLYFDFAGYSEMSNGLSLMMGFECPANFNLPYISGSITEFWRRWHISLSGWFRDYIYIPLGGNRCSAGRQMLNMLAVWALTGIWHGANWNFICWGLYYFVLLVIEKNFLMKYLKKARSGRTFTHCSWWYWAGGCSPATPPVHRWGCCSAGCSSRRAAFRRCISCAIMRCCWLCAVFAPPNCRGGSGSGAKAKPRYGQCFAASALFCARRMW